MSITEPHTSYIGGNRAMGKGRKGDKKGKQGNGSGTGRRRARNDDQFCIYG